MEANVETVQTASSTLGTVVNTKGVTDLPLSTRNYTNLIVSPPVAKAPCRTRPTIGKGSHNVSVNGSKHSQNTWQMDGVIIANYWQQRLVEQGAFGSIPDSQSRCIAGIQDSNVDL